MIDCRPSGVKKRLCVAVPMRSEAGLGDGGEQMQGTRKDGVDQDDSSIKQGSRFLHTALFGKGDDRKEGSAFRLLHHFNPAT
ncbi:hypothetical protein M0657_007795 [Pyricularia oryzae]|nr:hypothetical protein M9X92_007482 [Pyricularia oryzae]KAI7918056.1 hypothetical protein M0657_007795 [Pyricularia oryzae]